MPRILPPGGEVDWPREEGTLGVVGVAPWATVEFLRALYGQVRATKDWHYPRVLLDANSKIPSRGRHLQLGETDPSGAIAATIAELAAQGATVAVVLCNTAHLLFERWSRGAPIPVLHIVDETVAIAASQGARSAVAFTSSSLAQSDLYGRMAAGRGFRCARPTPPEQKLVDEIIASVKVSGSFERGQADRLGAVLARLSAEEVDTVIAGCTELTGIASLCDDAALRVVDSNVALARAALGRLNLSSERKP